MQDSQTDQLAQIPLSNGLHELPSEGLHSLHSNNMNEALLGPGSIGGRDGFHFQEPGQPSPDMPHHRRYGSVSHQASKLCMLGGAKVQVRGSMLSVWQACSRPWLDGRGAWRLHHTIAALARMRALVSHRRPGITAFLLAATRCAWKYSLTG